MANEFLFYDLQLMHSRAGMPKKDTSTREATTDPYEGIIQAIALNDASLFAQSVNDAGFCYTDSIPCTWMLELGRPFQKTLSLIEIADFYNSYKVVDCIVTSTSKYMFSHYAIGLLESHYEMVAISLESSTIILNYENNLLNSVNELSASQLSTALSELTARDLEQIFQVAFSRQVLEKINAFPIMLKFIRSASSLKALSDVERVSAIINYFIEDYITHFSKVDLFYAQTFSRGKLPRALADLNNADLNVFFDAMSDLRKTIDLLVTRSSVGHLNFLASTIKELYLQAMMYVVVRKVTLRYHLHNGDLRLPSMIDYVKSAFNNICIIEDQDITLDHWVFLNDIVEYIQENLPGEERQSFFTMFRPVVNSAEVTGLLEDLTQIKSLADTLVKQKFHDRISLNH